MIDPAFAARVALGVLGVAANKLVGRRRPFVVNHLVTVRCNLRCPFCYVSGPEQVEFNRERYPQKAEMDTAEMSAFYRQLVAEGFKIAIVLGGEPLLRQDLGQMLAVLRGKAFVTLFTNGFLLEERLELVASASNVFVSLDAPDRQHDQLRAYDGLFDRALDGLDALRTRLPRVKPALNMTVTRQNAQRVPEMLALAKKLALPIGFQPPSFEGQFTVDDRPRAKSAQEAAPVEAVIEAFRQIRAAARAGERVIGSDAFFEHVVENRPTYRCLYPSWVLGPVMPNGDVVACTKSRVMANVRHTPVAELVRSLAFQQNAAAGPGCAVGCRDWGIHDLSAALDGRFGLGDAKRYFGAFVA